ncbi:unnamed protein product [Cylicocyclus nassatus]|uniref:Nudix hydrolase domain-containing protein n=1 Tax=Cylicocyclus nassatus TaxID=53992 RepID=A0AA36LZL6_CYLNA|nr:unnamed protein product [Cylicocyclus nassatus]
MSWFSTYTYTFEDFKHIGVPRMRLLPAKTKVNGDLIVQTSTLARELKTTHFAEMLSDSLETWKELDVEVVHIRIELQDSFLVPLLAERGFKFSFVTTDEVTMSKWLPNSVSPLVPLGCNYHSVACLVVDELGRILMIKELKRISMGWKFPGGKAENREKIFQTAKRKVLEETGVHAIPEAIISLSHKAALHYSNTGTFFFCCLMHSKDGEEQNEPEHPHEYVVSWFTREELRSLDKEEFFDHHRDIFVEYDKWMDSNADKPFAASNNGWKISSLFLFSNV